MSRGSEHTSKFVNLPEDIILSLEIRDHPVADHSLITASQSKTLLLPIPWMNVVNDFLVH